MGEILSHVLQISFGTSLVIGGLLVFMPILHKKYSPSCYCLIWLILASRLIVPIQVEWKETINLIFNKEDMSFYEDRLEKYFDNEQTDQKYIEKNQMSEVMKDEEKYQLINKKSPDSKTDIGDYGKLGPFAKFTNKVKILETLCLENKVFGYVWISGILCFSLYYLVNYWHFIRECKRWQKEIKSEELKLFESLMNELEIRRSIRLIKSKKVQIPLIMGYINPVVILPYKEYGLQELYFILKHELIHYKQRDLWYKLVLLMAQVIHWFNPLVYIMVDQAEQDLEARCDLKVVGKESELTKRLYMQIILQAVESTNRNYVRFTTQLKSSKKTLLYRFENIISKENKRIGVSMLVLISALSVGISGCLNADSFTRQNKNIVWINGYSFELPDGWEATQVQEQKHYISDEHFVRYKLTNNGNNIGEISLEEVTMRNYYVRRFTPELSQDEKNKIMEAQKRLIDKIDTIEKIGEIDEIDGIDGKDGIDGIGEDRTNPERLDFFMEEEPMYTDLSWFNVNRSKECYCAQVALDRRKVKEEEVNQIIESFTIPTYLKNEPEHNRKALSIDEAEKNAVYIIYEQGKSYETYNESLLQDFIRKMKRHRRAQVDLLTYKKVDGELQIEKWYTLATDGKKSYLYDYKASDDSHENYHVLRKPDCFNDIIVTEKETGTLYELVLNKNGRRETIIEM